MKRYKLLKDLPTFKAGDEFFISESGNLIAGTPENPKKVLIGEDDSIVPIEVDLMAYAKETLEQFPNILTEWFEEIECKGWAISTLNSRVEEISNTPYSKWTIENLKSLDLLFPTKQEAEKHLERLKARAVIMEDTNGFKPDWSNFEQRKWYPRYDFENFDFNIIFTDLITPGAIYFEKQKDVKNSIKLHAKEWKIYLGVEQ